MLKGPLLSSSAGMPSIPAALRPFSFCKLSQTSRVVIGAFKASADGTVAPGQSSFSSSGVPCGSGRPPSLLCQCACWLCSALGQAECLRQPNTRYKCAMSFDASLSMSAILWYSYCRCFLRRTVLYMLWSFNAAKGTITGERTASFHSLQAYQHSSSNHGGCCLSFEGCRRLSWKVSAAALETHL